MMYYVDLMCAVKSPAEAREFDTPEATTDCINDVYRLYDVILTCLSRTRAELFCRGCVIPKSDSTFLYVTYG